jgi:hypothetical protein
MDTEPQNDGEFRTRWVRASVEMLEHPLLDKGPYCRRAAWLWLISSAAWKTKSVRHKGSRIMLERGQVLIGRSHLADTWGWSEQNVRTFLNQCMGEGMLKINQSTGHYANVATICNYDKYQSSQPVQHREANQKLTSAPPISNQTLTSTNITSSEDTPLPPKGAEPVEKPLPKFGKLEALEAFNAYNAVALRCGLPQAAKLTPNRERSIVARLKDYGLEGWHLALANIEKSKFLTGGTDRGFRADLDFVCQAKSFGKLHDGGYGNGRHSPLAPAPKPASVFAHPPKEREEDWQERIANEWLREQGAVQ